MTAQSNRLVVGMTGASGAIFGIRLLQLLKHTDIETHLILSDWARNTIEQETDWPVEQVEELADICHDAQDMGAAVSSGSFLTRGMVIIPCSLRTVGAIAGGIGEHLVHRAADVVLKERRRLVLVARETPLNDIHLENMLKLSRMGATILPPVPAFYFRPQTLEDIVDHIIMRTLDQFGIGIDGDGDGDSRWS